MKDLIIYELHVRGFTRDESSGVRYKGTFAGVVEKIPYLKELGINCVELLPIFEFDELENPRFGNNNAYCQDNRISWLDWSRLKENNDVFELFSTLTAFRSAHPVLRRSDHFMGVNSTGYPELSFHGTEPWCLDRYSPFHTFGFMYTESEKDYDADGDTFIYCAVNSYWEERTLRLPIIPEKMTWTILTYTSDNSISGKKAAETVTLMSRRVMLLVGRKI